MCRFLIAKSNKSFDPQPFVTAFTDMAKKSKALDGDWQGDGWGASYLNEKDEWKTYHSLQPVWNDAQRLTINNRTTQLVLHARSASFPSQKGFLEYNQPYTKENLSFVFNGLLRGVTFPSPLPGTI